MGLLAQKKGLATIDKSDLKAHMTFLASDELEGRDTGEPGMDIAARYLAVQAERLGLTPADSASSYMQAYAIVERTIDPDRSRIVVAEGDSSEVVIPEHFFLFPMPQESEVNIEGEVVFAGYGIHDEDNNYDDFADVDLKGKVVLIMTRAPMNEDGSQMLFDHDKWSRRMSMQYKLPYIYSQGPKAVLMVYDPKSGHQSMEDASPGISSYLSKSRSLKGAPPRGMGMFAGAPKSVMIHRSVADRLLESSGTSLQELQAKIDRERNPHSFHIDGKRVSIRMALKEEDVEISNVFGYLEGSDPALKDEMVIYLAHFDHVGTDGQGGVFNGADDNASGTVSLIELAEAFAAEKERPARSVGFLWVSAEEVGLFGSKYYADHPLYPLEKTAAAINLDMVGRVKTPEDEASDRSGLTVVGRDSVKVIGGLQSKVLMEINDETLGDMGLVGNYDYNVLDNPERYFYRSDHINFARKDIPVLFYSTGTHRDYHKVTDVEERIDYDKFLKMTQFTFMVGWNVANYRGQITVDRPMSSW